MAKTEDLKMLDAVAVYLKEKGWNLLVIGSPRVQKPPGDFAHNYEFVLRFTGSPPKDDPPKDES